MKNSYRLQLIFAAIISMIIGLVFILFPTDSLIFINYIMVITLIIIGLVQFIGYFVTSVKDNQFRIGFVLGLLCLILAAYTYFESSSIISFIPKLLGILVIVDSLITLQNSVDLLRLGSKRWWYQLVLAIITIMLGVILFFNPFNNYESFITFAGFTMIVNGALDLFNILYLSIRISKVDKDVDGYDTFIEQEEHQEEFKDQEEDEKEMVTTFKPINVDKELEKKIIAPIDNIIDNANTSEEINDKLSDEDKLV
jgi:uncharacterized membrane protein HdeD (DUF308 family)